MAATIAEATGYDRTRSKTTHRLGSQEAHTRAATWRTEVTASVYRDGTAVVSVRRDDKLLHLYRLDTPETEGERETA